MERYLGFDLSLDPDSFLFVPLVRLFVPLLCSQCRVRFVHSNWVADLKADFSNPSSATIGTEFIGTSISSGGDGSDTNANTEGILAENPHIKFFNGQRGYVRCELTPARWQSNYRVVTAVTTPEAPITTRASFVVENGKPGAQRV